MKPTFKKLNDELFNGSTVEMEKMSFIRGGKKTKVKTDVIVMAAKDTVSTGDDDSDIDVIIVIIK